jgi:hypothetical protein
MFWKPGWFFVRVYFSFAGRFLFFIMLHNGGNMASGGLRASSLSTDTNLDAGQKCSKLLHPPPLAILRVMVRNL